MKVAEQIQQVLADRFSPDHLDVINESDMHNVPKGSESHFKVVLVSSQFDSQRAVQRHQSVYAAMGTLMDDIHALALHTYTLDEWRKKMASPDSPDCLGGSKKP